MIKDGFMTSDNQIDGGIKTAKENQKPKNLEDKNIQIRRLILVAIVVVATSIWLFKARSARQVETQYKYQDKYQGQSAADAANTKDKTQKKPKWIF
jgi:hypothetical protein